MRQTRIYTSQPLSPADNVVLTGSASHYLARVLRSSEGDSITLFNGDGRDYIGQISEIRAKKVLVRLVESQFPDNESSLKITLVQAITRGERMDYTLQKATELGVFGIQPVTSQRVEIRLKETRLASRMKHWQGVVISACEQSGRAFVPEVSRPLSLAQWLSSPDKSPRWVLDPLATDRMSSMTKPEEAVSILVGPEGGFSAGEMDQLRSRDVKPVSLGPRVLRTETAGPAALAVLQALAGDI
jgi:16S rRNA (uracil1498-N3)-methyltransferase